MGDRYYSYYNCPKCGEKNGVEIYDAPSCLQYLEACQYCDYKVDLDYYEETENCLVLLSKSDAEKKGYFCQFCNNYLLPGIERITKVCIKCKTEEKNEKIT